MFQNHSSIDERTTKFRLDVKVMDEHDNEIEMADVDDEDAAERKVDLQQKSAPESQKKLLINKHLR